MDSDKEEADVFSDTDAPLREDEEEELEEYVEKEEDEEEDARIFNTWMQRYRAAEQPSRAEDEEEVEEVVEAEPLVRRRADRRASLPCPATLLSMQLSRLHSSTKTPVTARVLLHRNSSRSLLLSPQQVAAPAAPTERRPSLIPTIPEVTAPERRGQFRRRNVMSLSDADSVCLICHHELRGGGGGARELQCSHTFHRECIEEWLWRKPSCPTCHVQVSPSPSSSWTSTRVRVP